MPFTILLKFEFSEGSVNPANRVNSTTILICQPAGLRSKLQLHGETAQSGSKLECSGTPHSTFSHILIIHSLLREFTSTIGTPYLISRGNVLPKFLVLRHQFRDFPGRKYADLANRPEPIPEIKNLYFKRGVTQILEVEAKTFGLEMQMTS